MNKAANTYWVDNRLRAQRVSTRAVPSPASPARELSREIIGTRTEIRRRGGLIPSWVVFVMIALATFALCVTVTTRMGIMISLRVETTQLRSKVGQTGRRASR